MMMIVMMKKMRMVIMILCKPKINDLEMSVAVQQKIFRFQVPVVKVFYQVQYNMFVAPNSCLFCYLPFFNEHVWNGEIMDHFRNRTSPLKLITF